MKTRIAVTIALGLLTAACATTTPPSSRFGDIPLPKGLTYRPNRSVVIESATVRAAQLVYRGRLEPVSLGDVMRAQLESNGWRTVSRTMTTNSTSQIYEKDGKAVEIHIHEELWYTYLTIRASEALSTETAATGTDGSEPRTAQLDASVDPGTTPETEPAPNPRGGDQSFTDKVKHFFSNLFTW
jgi:hypothetical protein